MIETGLYESLLVEVASMQREVLIDRLIHFPGNLRLDFSPEYLADCETEKLRHLLMAAMWRSGIKAQQALGRP